MHTTRSTHLLRRMVGFAAVPVLLVTATACGGDDDDSADGGGGDSSSFCDDVRALEDEFGDANDSDAETFDAAMQAFSQLDPPAELAEDWELMMSSLDLMSDIDIENPESIDQDAMAEAGEAADRVNTYMEEECGVDAG